MDLKPIESIVAGCEYRNINPLREEMRLMHNSGRAMLFLMDFYRHDRPTNVGTCSELMNFSYLHPSLQNSRLHLLRARGRDTEFYFSRYSEHWFLLAAEEDIMHGVRHTRDPEGIAMILESSNSVFVVDPCFKKVADFHASGYAVQELNNRGHPMTHPNSTILTPRQGVPLGMTSQRKIVGLYYDPGSRSLIRIKIRGSRMPWEDCEGYWQRSERFRANAFPDHDLASIRIDAELAGEPELMEVINALRAKKVEATRDIPNIDENVTIC